MSEPGNICEETVYESLFRAHARTLRNFLYYKCGDVTVAEDLAQEAFLKLWHNCARVTFDKAKGFLYTVAGNLFLDRARHEQVALRFQMAFKPGPHAEAPDFDLETRELHARLEQAINQLPENQRIVFLMNRMDDMTYTQIAETLNLSVKAVEKRMHGALVALRSVLKGI